MVRFTVFTSKTFKKKVQLALTKTKIMGYVAEIESVDPLSTILYLKRGTRAHGFLPLLGPQLPNSPIGIFRGSMHKEMTS